MLRLSGILLLYCSTKGLATQQVQEVGVNLCCPPGQHLSARRSSGGLWRVGCGPVEGEDRGLQGHEVVFQDFTGRNTTLVLKKVGEKLPVCQRGLQVHSIRAPQGATLTPRPDGVQLRGGSSDREGDVFLDGRPVCDDDWGPEEARVVCRMLGYPGSLATSGSSYGSMSGHFLMDNTGCSGLEHSLRDCPHDGSHDCNGGEAAGVVCSEAVPEDSATVRLSPEGTLLREGAPSYQQVATDQFCLAGWWQAEVSGPTGGPGWPGPGSGWQTRPDTLLAFTCDQCLEEVVCSNILSFFESLKPGNKQQISVDPKDRLFNLNENIVNVADLNEDKEVDFDEFVGKIVNYTTILFDVLDDDNDGSLTAASLLPSTTASMDLVTTVTDEMFKFFDTSQDEAVSVQDFSTFLSSDCSRSNICDTNDDGNFSLAEILDMYLINLPAPLYNFYRRLDFNKNEALGHGEAMAFVRAVFSALDTDQDCFLQLEEVLSLLASLGLPRDQLLALRLLAQHYLSLGNFLVQEALDMADRDRDGLVSLEEVIGFSDFGLVERAGRQVGAMGQPSLGTVEYLVGGSSVWGEDYRDQSQAITATWLTVLQGLLDLPSFTAPPADYCSTVSNNAY